MRPSLPHDDTRLKQRGVSQLTVLPRHAYVVLGVGRR